MLFITLACSPHRPIRVLVITGGHGFEEAPFWAMFGSMPGLDIHRATQQQSSEAYGRADLLDYDVVVLYDMVQTITEAEKQQFLRLFDAGIGLVAMHHCLASYQQWPQFEKIIGGKYLLEDEQTADSMFTKSDYRHDVKMPIVIVAPEHPIVQGMENFTIHDEIYINYRVQPDVTPLLRTTHPESGNPVVWCRQYRQSRVVYIQPGHDHHTYNLPAYRKLVERSIIWAAQPQKSGVE